MRVMKKKKLLAITEYKMDKFIIRTDEMGALVEEIVKI